MVSSDFIVAFWATFKNFISAYSSTATTRRKPPMPTRRGTRRKTTRLANNRQTHTILRTFNG